MEATIVATENMIMENPYIGRPYKHCDDIRYIALARSPFAFIYRINDNEIEVLRVWDWRKDHAALRLE